MNISVFLETNTNHWGVGKSRWGQTDTGNENHSGKTISVDWTYLSHKTLLLDIEGQLKGRPKAGRRMHCRCSICWQKIVMWHWSEKLKTDGSVCVWGPSGDPLVAAAVMRTRHIS